MEVGFEDGEFTTNVYISVSNLNIIAILLIWKGEKMAVKF